MKAIILAAGRGSRLKGLTDDLPKSMLKLNKKHTLLSLNLKKLSEAGIDSIIMVIGYQAQKIKLYAQKIANNYEIKIEFIYNPFWCHCNVLGSFYMALGKIKDSFIFLHADTLFDIEVIEGLMQSKSDACLAVDFKECGEEEMKVWIDKNKIKRITKDDIGYQADGEFVGIAKFSTKMEKYFSDKSVEIFQTNELNSYMEKVLDNGVISGDLKLDYFDSTCFKTIEVDFSEDLIIAKTLFSNEK